MTLTPESARTPPTFAAPEPFDRALIAATWGGTEDAVLNVLAMFARATAQDATGLRAAIDTGDMAQTSHFAHRMLGAARMIGATVFAKICETIVLAGRSNDRQAIDAGLQEFEPELAKLMDYIAAGAASPPAAGASATAAC